MNKQIQKEIRFGWSLRHTTETETEDACAA